MIDISSENEKVQALVKKAGFRFKLWLVAWSVVYFVQDRDERNQKIKEYLREEYGEDWYKDND